MTTLGIFVQVRVSDALNERLREAVSTEADRLEALPDSDRVEAVDALGGDVHAQLLTADGEVRASSRLVADPLLPSASLPRSVTTAPRWDERTVKVLDDDDAAAGLQDAESEPLVLRVSPAGDDVLVVGTSREDADETLTALRSQLLIAGPLALALAGGLGYLVAGVGLRPIERMRARAATISARTAGERLPVPAADDELRRLALTLNAMIDRLDNSLNHERRFVAEASHDLRTPLALMLTEIELALEQPRTPDELTQALHSLDDEVRRLIALAEDLLERTGAEEVGVPIEARPVDLVSLARRVADRFAAGAGDRTIRVTGSPRAEIQGDVAHLDRALSNLLDNALRHGDGDIGIEVRGTRAGADITVTDEGAGFKSDSRSAAAGGLGLTIAEEIARAHGGTMTMEHADGQTRVCLDLSSPGA
jgi:signal transduction histidine kinase